MSCDKEADVFFLLRSEEEWKKMINLLQNPCTPTITKLVFKVTQSRTFGVVV